MRIDYDFLDLEVFLTVKETGSFHRAAQRLNLSQSSVTRRIQKLEAALGAVLFERTTRDVRPTLAAKRLQFRAEAILEDARETTRALRDENAAYARQRAQIVTLATIPTVLRALVAPAIRRYRAEGNHSRIRVLDLAANEVAEAVAEGEADLGLCSVPMLEPSTEFMQLVHEPLVLAIPADHPLADQNEVRWSDLAGEALILPAPGTGNRMMIDEALARTRTPVRWTYEVGRSTTALNLVAEGLGVAVSPRMALSGAEGETVSWRPLVQPTVSRPIGVLSRIGHKATTAAAKLASSIAASAKKLRDREAAP